MWSIGLTGWSGDAEHLAGRRIGVVDAGGGRAIEQDRGAAGRPPRIGEVAHADAGHVGQRPGAPGRARGLAGVAARRLEPGGARESTGHVPPEMPS